MASSKHRALLITSHTEPPSVVTRDAPNPTAGTVLVRVLAAPVLSYARDIYPPNNTRQYPYPIPIVPGTGGIGRVETPPPDSALLLKPGQLVLISSYVRSREDPRAGMAARYLLGTHQGFTEGAKALMESGCRDGGYTELTLAPTECVFVLDEARLLGSPAQGGLGLDAGRIAAVTTSFGVAYGGFRAAGVKPGETIVVAPSTGLFGGGAVVLALCMGARVIAMGRSTEKLDRLKVMVQKFGKAAQLQTVQITGDAEKEADALRAAAGLGGVDVFFEISPPEAGAGGVTPSYIPAAINSLRMGGRVALMGGIRGDIAIPCSRVMHWDISIFGKWMYEPADVRDVIKMIEAGTLRVDWANIVGRFPLDRWEEAWNCAAENTGVDELTVMEPQS